MTIDATPAGDKPTSPMRDALDAELARAGDDGEGHKVDVLQLVARKLAAKALEGDLGAIKEIFDRMDGKAVAGSAPEQTRKVEMQWKEQSLRDRLLFNLRNGEGGAPSSRYCSQITST